MYRLVFLDGPNKGRRITVKQGDVLVGADADCALCLRHPSVVGRHAWLEQRPGGVFLKSLSALGKVLVNGQAIREHRLSSGDEFSIGGMTFLYQASEPAVKTSRRRAGKFHGLTFTAVGLLLTLQAVIVLGLIVFWRFEPMDTSEETEILPVTTRTDWLQERLRLQCQVPEPDAQPVTNHFMATPFWVVTPLMEQGRMALSVTPTE